MTFTVLPVGANRSKNGSRLSISASSQKFRNDARIMWPWDDDWEDDLPDPRKPVI
jgi:hypothetical protein